MNFVPQLSPRQLNRLHALKKALKKKKLDLRSDSNVSWDFIFYGQGAKFSDIDEVVLKMCKAHYLHNYCDFERGYRMALPYKSRIKLQHWLGFVRHCVLLTTPTQKYPKVWPWLMK